MLLQQLINGLMLGASYSLVAIGYTLIFGVLRLLHFAHGEVFMIGAFIGLQIVLTFAGAGIYVAIMGAMLSTALLGVIIRCCHLPWHGAPPRSLDDCARADNPPIGPIYRVPAKVYSPDSPDELVI